MTSRPRRPPPAGPSSDATRGLTARRLAARRLERRLAVLRRPRGLRSRQSRRDETCGYSRTGPPGRLPPVRDRA